MSQSRYKVESRPIIDLARDVKSGRLILSPYFQRELVWRDVHKREFIDTILRGFPFPLIFVSRGKIDVERMQATSLLVDGQQRLSTIMEFLNDEIDIAGKKFSEWDIDIRESFLKYEVPVIDLDFPEDDPRIKEVFRRLNRTLYSLTEIERLGMEYAASDFMLTAKLLARQLVRQSGAGRNSNIGQVDNDEEFSDLGYEDRSANVDPNIPPEFWQWTSTLKIVNTHKLLLDSSVFSSYEISRQVHLMFSLNLLATIIDGGFYSRNERVREYLEDFSNAMPDRNKIIERIEFCCGLITRANFSTKSYWKTKANTFSLIICLYRNIERAKGIPPALIKERLEAFSVAIPSVYQLAAKEAVNRKRERTLRHSYLEKIVIEGCAPDSLQLEV